MFVIIFARAAKRLWLEINLLRFPEENMRYVNTRLLLAAAIASLGLKTAASAADLPARTYAKAPEYVPQCAWCGWYIGVNGGGAWGDRTGDIRGFSSDFTQVVAFGLTPSQLGAAHNGGFGGGQFGYNWTMSNWVAGFEADIQGSDIGSTNTINFAAIALGPTATSVSTGRDHIDWFGTVRGRLGVTFGTILFYGTGGLAFGGAQSSVCNAIPALGVNFTGSSSDTRFGWAAGAGLEWMVASNWSLKAEYLHVDLGSSNVTMTDPLFSGPAATYRFHHEFDSARIGVNYHFGGPIVAKY
jgi:outer membrane immunogenic protein